MQNGEIEELEQSEVYPSRFTPSKLHISIHDYFGQEILSDSGTAVDLTQLHPDQDDAVFVATDSFVSPQVPTQILVDHSLQQLHKGSLDFEFLAAVRFENISESDLEPASDSGFNNAHIFRPAQRSQPIYFRAEISDDLWIAQRHLLTVPGGRDVCPRGSVFGGYEEWLGEVEWYCVECPEKSYTVCPTFLPSPSSTTVFSSEQDLVENLCLRCPDGAECKGGDSFAPKLSLSRWLQTEYLWKLVACPEGYRMIWGEQGVGQDNYGTSWDHDVQSCQKCGPGTFVLNSSSPFETCRLCPKNAQCVDGKPPIFNPVTASLSLEGLDVNSPQVLISLRETLAQKVDILKRQLYTNFV